MTVKELKKYLKGFPLDAKIHTVLNIGRNEDLEVPELDFELDAEQQGADTENPTMLFTLKDKYKGEFETFLEEVENENNLEMRITATKDGVYFEVMQEQGNWQDFRELEYKEEFETLADTKEVMIETILLNL